MQDDTNKRYISMVEIHNSPMSCDGCKWEETRGYAGECFHCARAYYDYYEERTDENDN